jgi:predicted PurR-regulated permease PerM
MADSLPTASRPTPPISPAASLDFASGLPLQVGVVVIAALYFAREVLIPITLAILLSFLLSPLVELFRRWHLGRVPSVLLAVILALAVILGFGGVIGSQVAQLATNIPQYAATIETKVDTIRDYTVGRIDRLAASLGDRAIPLTASQIPPGNHAPAGRNPGRPETEPHAATSAAASPLELAERYLSPALSPLATTGIVFVVAIFILLQREDLRDRLIRLFGASDLHRTTAALDDAARRLSTYFLTQLAINASFGLVIGVGLYFIGVPNPVLWGMLSALLRFVPYVGTYISAALPIALAAAADPGWSMAIWTTALYLGVDLLVSQAVEPMLYGQASGLSPLAVVVAAIFWTWLWGAIGLILSTPLTLCLVVLGRHAERLKFLDILLGDRPALTPVESFYQRILAGDPDEAQDQAELLLKDRSLSTYYEEVALEGLRLAANDAQRGVLRGEQLDRVKNATKELVSELAVHDVREPALEESDVVADPPPNSAEREEPAPQLRDTQILCLAGKGPLDEAASIMLAQLLGKHGLTARVLPYEAASREGILSLNGSGTTMVCVTYLEISGAPSHLRYLVQRLRRTIPRAPILIGFWEPEDEVVKELRVRAVIGADYYATSLREAVDSCLKAADDKIEVAVTFAETSQPKPGRNSHPELDSEVSHCAGPQEITRRDVQEPLLETRA